MSRLSRDPERIATGRAVRRAPAVAARGITWRSAITELTTPRCTTSRSAILRAVPAWRFLSALSRSSSGEAATFFCSSMTSR
jgi:hypothetical protein